MKSNAFTFSKWEFGTLGIYDFITRSGTLANYFNEVEKSVDLPGDIVECGVYRGHSLISTALLLKKLGSNKKVWGYDTFSGFPPILHDYDQPSMFNQLFKSGSISTSHYDAHIKSVYLSSLRGRGSSPTTISSSGSFANTSLDQIYSIINYFELDNIVLVKGEFSQIKSDPNNIPDNISLMLLDCDLYLSYKDCLDTFADLLCVHGSIYLDEYFSLKFPGAKIAVDEFVTLNKNFALFKYENLLKGEFERWKLLKNVDVLNSNA